jgi:hypothetical protein
MTDGARERRRTGFGGDANDGDRGREIGVCKKHDNGRSQ